jgi:hypothetical protein
MAKVCFMCSNETLMKQNGQNDSKICSMFPVLSFGCSKARRGEREAKSAPTDGLTITAIRIISGNQRNQRQSE